jgi:hypothetical protein
MNKSDWNKYQVTNVSFGTKLVSELTLAQAKTELCIAIDMIEQMVEHNKKAMQVVTKQYDND